MTFDQTSPSIAYFSMEIGLDNAMPTYSGGLGVLSGDTLRAAADLGLPMLAVSLLYRQGFFRQQLDAVGNQSETPATWEPANFLRQLEARVQIKIGGRDVTLAPWLYTVRGVRGREIPVFLLDADLPENAPEDRILTGRLYGGDSTYRLSQEAVLGLGGIAMLRALGFADIQTYHMNEGHCALLSVALLREAASAKQSAAIEAVRRRCVFTTHTPVPAGHDRFDFQLTEAVLGAEVTRTLTSLNCFPDKSLNMTHLALYLSRYANGVARRHAEVAREMHPDYQIHAITNGVHATTWASPPFASLFDREIPEWRLDGHNLRQALAITLDQIGEAHANAKVNLVEEVRRRGGMSLDPAALTIGFARRAATYKRADFVFSDIERLEQIAAKAGHIQFVFAGKAHPNDEAGKDLIKQVFAASEALGKKVPVVYLPDYDMDLGRILCAGVDVWLNNPVRPQEASGTSGMKAALNGVPSLSSLDGWWIEGFSEGVTGWSIGASVEPNGDTNDEVEDLYHKLEHIILPLYYGKGDGFDEVRRNAIAFNGSYFTSQRMMQQYWQDAYQNGRLH